MASRLSFPGRGCYALTSSGPLTTGYSSQTLAFFARLPTLPSETRRALYNTLINTLVLKGVWSLLDCLYIFAADTQGNALVNLVQSSFTATAVNSPTFTVNNGFNGDGATSYVDTNFNATTATSPQFIQNSATAFAWTLTNGNGTQSAMAIFQNTTGDTFFCPGTTTGPFLAVINGPGAASANVTSSGTKGFYAITRRTSSLIDFYENGAANATGLSQTSGSPDNGTFKVGTDGFGDFDTVQVAAAGLGSQLNAGNHLDLYNAIHVYLQAVAGIP